MMNLFTFQSLAGQPFPLFGPGEAPNLRQWLDGGEHDNPTYPNDKYLTDHSGSHFALKEISSGKYDLNASGLITGVTGYPSQGTLLDRSQCDALHNGTTIFTSPVSAFFFRALVYVDGTTLTQTEIEENYAYVGRVFTPEQSTVITQDDAIITQDNKVMTYVD